MNRYAACLLTTSLGLVLVSVAAVAAAPSDAVEVRSKTVMEALTERACANTLAQLQTPNAIGVPLGVRTETRSLARRAREAACQRDSSRPALKGEVEVERPGYAPAPARSASRSVALAATGLSDGSVIERRTLAVFPSVVIELVSYASSGLVVGGVLCYPNDQQPHSAVLHIHGGFEGIFDATAGNLLQTCIDWAGLHGRTMFAPSFRGQDGGEGERELCLGEADDVAAAAIMLRSLEVTDPQRVGMVGGSAGACVALKASGLIPDLRAVVAFVPPTDWKGFVDFHRTSYEPATEVACDGSTFAWDIGGAEMADSVDSIICGQPGCTDAEYNARSPISALLSQSAPTLVVTAVADNIVPFGQQILWSILRERQGNPVDVYVIDKCDEPGTPAAAEDALIVTLGAFHNLGHRPVSSGLLFLLEALDAPAFGPGNDPVFQLNPTPGPAEPGPLSL